MNYSNSPNTGKLCLDDVCFISLGGNCAPRVFIDAVFDTTKMYTDKCRMPFDGALHEFHMVCKVFDTDFSHFCTKENIHILGKEGKYYNPFYKSKYLHEHPDTTVQTMVSLQEKRVNQFRKVMNSGKKIVFLYNGVTPTDKDLTYLNTSIKKSFPDTTFLIIGIIQTRGTKECVVNPNQYTYIVDFPILKSSYILKIPYVQIEYGVECMGYLWRNIFKIVKSTIHPQLEIPWNHLNRLLDNLKKVSTVKIDMKNKDVVDQADRWVSARRAEEEDSKKT